MLQRYSSYSTYSKGLIYAILSYVIWGFFPIYWKLLKNVPSEQLLAHRIVWSLVFISIILIIRRDKLVRLYLRNKKTVLWLLLTSIFIGGNWFVYIYAVNHDHIVDASLGYYINPLINILLGTVFLKERLNKLQIIALIFAFCGVAYLSLHIGRLPIISLFLAISFGLYGLVRKVANLQSIPGLFIETLILAPIAIGYLFFTWNEGTAVFLHQGITRDLLLLISGPITAIPLIWFGMAATRIPLSTLGFVQYISPSLQLAIGILVFNENFNYNYLICFILVWIGLIIYSTSIVKTLKNEKAENKRAKQVQLRKDAKL